HQHPQEVLNPSSGLYCFGPEIVFVALDVEDLFSAVRRAPSVDELAKAKDEIRGTIAALTRELHARSTSLIVVHELTFTGWSPHGILDNRRADGLSRWTEDVNRDLAEDIGSQTHTFLLPLRQLLSRAATD